MNFYSPFKGKIGGAEVEISGGYPIGDSAEVKIRVEKPTRVSFRIPSWSARTLVDGKLAKGPWHSVEVDGEKTVKIGFDMSPRVVDSPPFGLLRSQKRFARKPLDGLRVGSRPSGADAPQRGGDDQARAASFGAQQIHRQFGRGDVRVGHG